MIRRTHTAIALASIVLAGPAAAATEGGSGSTASAGSAGSAQFCDAGFMSSDSNSDGTIDRAEYDAARSSAFGALDANADGQISRAEYVECLNRQMPDMQADASAGGTTDSTTGSTGSTTGTSDMQADASTGTTTTGSTDATDSAASGGSDVADSGSILDGDRRMPQFADEMSAADLDGSGSVDTREYIDATRDARSAASDASADAQGDAVLVFRRYIMVPSAMTDSDIAGMGEEETASRAARQFQRYDSDSSGEISQEEWENASTMQNDVSEVLNMEFDRMDSDSSDSISEAEYGDAGERDWSAAQDAMAPQDSAGDSGSATNEEATAAADDTTTRTPEQPGTRGSAGSQNPPVVYFRFFNPLTAG